MTKRIAILGAGASGIVAIKACLDEGLDPVCFERTDDIGGLWNFTDNVKEEQACVMKTTVINTSKEMMPYSDYPIPADFPNFMHNTKVMEYFRSYTKHFGLDKYIKFKTIVNSVKQTEDFATTGKWKLEIQYPDSDSVKTEIFDAVYLCTGHHTEKRIPHFEGYDVFQGQKVHTHDYKDHRGFEDKRVVVIGIGNSGGDVAVELSRIAKQVYLSTRRGSWVINRVQAAGMPGDIKSTRRFVNHLKMLIGEKKFNSVAERQVNQRFDHAAYGLKPSHRFNAQHPMVNDELPNRIVCGSIIVKPDIASFHKSGVEFVDGTVEEDIDVVICATGYKFGFPYLDKKVIDVQDNKVNLFKYAFPPDLEKPTLVVIGCIQPWGAIMPIAELQCRWAARVFKGVTKLPSASDMWADIRKKQSDMVSRYVSSPRHTIQVDWIEFMDDVAEQFGVKPSMLKLFMSDPSLAMKVYFGPCTPYQYRLQGPGQWTGAREAIMTTMDRVYKPFKTRPVAADESGQSRLMYIIAFVILAVIIKVIFF